MQNKTAKRLNNVSTKNDIKYLYAISL